MSRLFNVELYDLFQYVGDERINEYLKCYLRESHAYL